MPAEMTDLELTRLCAEAMEREIDAASLEAGIVLLKLPEDARAWNGLWYRFNPLHDDTQAMELMKKFKSPHFQVWSDDETTSGKWHAWMQGQPDGTSSDSLNRAICECVANRQKAK